MSGRKKWQSINESKKLQVTAKENQESQLKVKSEQQKEKASKVLQKAGVVVDSKDVEELDIINNERKVN